MHITLCRLEVLEKILGEKSLFRWYVVSSLCFIGHTQLSLFLFSHHWVQNFHYDVFLLSPKVEWRKGKRWKVSFSNITTIWAMYDFCKKHNTVPLLHLLFMHYSLTSFLLGWKCPRSDFVYFICLPERQKDSLKIYQDHKIIIHFCTACFMCLQ